MLYLDGVHFSIRHGDKADATIILTALGVDLEGNKEVPLRGRREMVGEVGCKTCVREGPPRSTSS